MWKNETFILILLINGTDNMENGLRNLLQLHLLKSVGNNKLTYSSLFMSGSHQNKEVTRLSTLYFWTS